ncbi:MAG: 5-formyltetrahydrofolate cyclo-ligase [Treponema sp.]|nr:5-formyltetrahydrofolate cyclo-ligase [Treponema sp.]
MDCGNADGAGGFDKPALRRKMKAVLGSLGAEERAFFSHKACVSLVKSELFLSADIVLSYMATGTEADPFRISSAALTAFKMLAFPVCAPRGTKGNTMDFYFVHGAGDMDSFMSQFTKNRYGIWEPAPLSAAKVCLPPVRAKNILVIVPGLAFSPRGGRLGHGAGYYDRYLTALKLKALEHDCTLSIVGLCFDCQLLASIPLDGHDVPMDYILTQSGFARERCCCRENML